MSRPLRVLVAALAAAALPADAAAKPFAARLLLPDGAPAAGFVVSVVGGTMTVPCAADGSFRLDPAPPPPFRIVATGPEGQLSAPLEIAAVGDAEVELRLPPVARDSLTVVAGIAPSLDLLPANAATVVAAEALEQRPPQRLVDALELVAGASKLGEGADSVPALRGLARGRTLILIDGARVAAERRAGPSATFVDPATLAAVEVLRGPGAVTYGSDAFGGVLNAVTRDPEPQRALRFVVEGSTGGQRQRGGSLAVSLPVGAGALLLEAHATDAGGAEAGGGGAIFNSAFDSAGGALRYLRTVGPGRLRVALQIDRVADLGKAAIDSRQVRAVYPHEASDRLVVSWLGARLPQWDALEATLFLGAYRVDLDRDRAPTATSNRRIDSSETEAKDAQLRVLAGRGFAGGRLLLGVDAHSRFDLRAEVGHVEFAADGESVASRTTSAAIGEARQASAGLFATWERALADRWSLAAGARADRVASENRGGFFGARSRSASAASGNVALTWAPADGWSATAQLARGFRVPTLSDRYFRGPSGRGSAIGNPDLDPESSAQVDLALRRTRGRSALAVYAYRYRIDDLIERFAAGDDFRFRNRGSATLAGLEVEAQARIAGRWSLDGGGAWTRGRTDGGAPIDDQAAPSLFLGARFAESWGYVFARLGLHAEKDDPGPTELARPGYALLDLGGGWRISERYELRLLVRNALDRRYTGAADEAADRAPGRGFLLALSGEL